MKSIKKIILERYIYIYIYDGITELDGSTPYVAKFFSSCVVNSKMLYDIIRE